MAESAGSSSGGVDPGVVITDSEGVETVVRPPPDMSGGSALGRSDADGPVLEKDMGGCPGGRAERESPELETVDAVRMIRMIPPEDAILWAYVDGKKSKVGFIEMLPEVASAFARDLGRMSLPPSP